MSKLIDTLLDKIAEKAAEKIADYVIKKGIIDDPKNPYPSNPFVPNPKNPDWIDSIAVMYGVGLSPYRYNTSMVESSSATTISINDKKDKK